MSNTQIKLFIALIFVATAVVLIAQGHAPSKEYWHPFSSVVTIVTFLMLLWERYLWSWPILRLISKRPNIRGTWKGVLKSGWIDPTTNEAIEPIQVFIVVRQTFTSLDVRLFSQESNSVSLSANLIADSAGVHTLAVTYLNTPNALKLENSPISHGGMLLTLHGDGTVSQLEGKYWTDRKTLGHITLNMRIGRICHHFGEASKAFGKKNRSWFW